MYFLRLLRRLLTLTRSGAAGFGLGATLALLSFAALLSSVVEAEQLSVVSLEALLQRTYLAFLLPPAKTVALLPVELYLRWPLEPGAGLFDPVVLGGAALAALGVGLVSALGVPVLEGLFLLGRPAGPRLRWTVRIGAALLIVGLFLATASPGVPLAGWLALAVAASCLLVISRRGSPLLPWLLTATIGLELFGVSGLPAHAQGRLPMGARGGVSTDPHRIIEHPDAPPPAQRLQPDWEAPALPEGLEVARRVIVIVVDTLRADHVSTISGGRETTPGLDRVFAKEGVVFERAYSAAPWTLPSTTSLFTSLYPPQHGVEGNSHKLHEELVTLAGAFSTQERLSAAFVTHIYASSRFGLDSGFGEFHELSIDWGFGEGRQLRAGAVREQVVPWLEQHQDEPFFLYLHLFDPHWDYDPPPPFDRKFTDPDYEGPFDGTWSSMWPYLPKDKLIPEDGLQHSVDLYDGEIAYTDVELLRLFGELRRLGLWEDSAVFVLSDHGEEFQEHDSVGHISSVFEEMIHVPLLLKLPGGRSETLRARVGSTVRSVDVAPTALHLAGLKIPPSFEGESLLSLLPADAEALDRPVYARVRRSWISRAAYLEGKLKLVRDPRGADPSHLYDLALDPGETRAIERRRPGDFVRLESALLRLEEEMVERMRGPGEAVELSADEEAALRALGYVQ